MKKLADGAWELGITLTSEQLGQFQLFSDELLKWNRRTNLTAITHPEEVETKHFLDSLSVVLALPSELSKPIRVLDVGTGPGFPGLPLAMLFPNAKFTLLEATWKKTSFIQHMVQLLKLSNVTVVNERSETAANLLEHREQYDVVLARAVAPLATLAELTLPFCKSGGVLVALKKGDITKEVKESEKATGLMGGRLRTMVAVRLQELTDERVLVVVEKTGHTPDGYPRRPGVPANKPIL